MKAFRGMTSWMTSSLFLLVGVFPASVLAQIDAGHDVRFTVTPYGWVSGLDGTVGLGPLQTNVDLGAGDILNALKFGIMGTGEIRRGAWLLMADGIYVSLGEARTLAIRGDTGSLGLQQRETIIQPMIGYVLGDSLASLDLLGGARYWNVSSTLNVDRTTRPSNERSMSREWLDASVGARARVKPFDRVRFVAEADVGGGGSRLDWQWYTSLGYDVWSKVTLGASYRALDVDYRHSNFIYDTRMGGFIAGATFRSW